MSAITQAELSVLDFIREHVGCALFDRLMPAVTFLGDGGAVWIVLTAALLIFRRSRRYGAMLALSLMMGAFVCNAVLKPLVARARPFEAGGFSGLLIAAPDDFSFPSGHTTAAFAAAAVFLLAGIRGRWAVLALAALIMCIIRRMFWRASCSAFWPGISPAAWSEVSAAREIRM